MKHIKLVVLTCLFSVVNYFGFAQCTTTLWSHVYHNYRLAVHDSCMSISGQVYSLIYEADGDIHIRITLDSPFTYMLNSVNYSGQYGKLVIEPICATTCTQADAISSCAGFSNTVFIPAVGEHVIVKGSYVTDNDHGWNEIHPVTSIVIGTLLGVPSTVPNATMDVSVFPNPANEKVNFQLKEKANSTVYISISDGLGRLAGQYQLLEMQNLEINTQYLPIGKYYYNIRQEGGKFIKGGTFDIIR